MTGQSAETLKPQTSPTLAPPEQKKITGFLKAYKSIMQQLGTDPEILSKMSAALNALNDSNKKPLPTHLFDAFSSKKKAIEQDIKLSEGEKIWHGNRLQEWSGVIARYLEDLVVAKNNLVELLFKVEENLKNATLSFEEGARLIMLRNNLAQSLTLVIEKIDRIHNFFADMDMYMVQTKIPKKYASPADDDKKSPLQAPDGPPVAMQRVMQISGLPGVINRFSGSVNPATNAEMQTVSKAWQRSLREDKIIASDLKKQLKEVKDQAKELSQHKLLFNYCRINRDFAKIILLEPADYGFTFPNCVEIALGHNLLNSRAYETLFQKAMQNPDFLNTLADIAFNILTLAPQEVFDQIKRKLGSKDWLTIMKEDINTNMGIISLYDLFIKKGLGPDFSPRAAHQYLRDWKQELVKFKALGDYLLKNLSEYDKTTYAMRDPGMSIFYLKHDETFTRDVQRIISLAIQHHHVAIFIANNPSLINQFTDKQLKQWNKIVTEKPGVARIILGNNNSGFNKLGLQELLILFDRGLAKELFIRFIATGGLLKHLNLDSWVKISYKFPELTDGIIAHLYHKLSTQQLLAMANHPQDRDPQRVKHILARIILTRNISQKEKAAFLALVPPQQRKIISNFFTEANKLKKLKPADLVDVAMAHPELAPAIIFSKSAKKFTLDNLYKIAIKTIDKDPDIVKFILEAHGHGTGMHQETSEIFLVTQLKLLNLVPKTHIESTVYYLEVIGRLAENPEFDYSNVLTDSLDVGEVKESKINPNNIIRDSQVTAAPPQAPKTHLNSSTNDNYTNLRPDGKSKTSFPTTNIDELMMTTYLITNKIVSKATELGIDELGLRHLLSLKINERDNWLKQYWSLDKQEMLKNFFTSEPQDHHTRRCLKYLAYTDSWLENILQKKWDLDAKTSKPTSQESNVTSGLKSDSSSCRSSSSSSSASSYSSSQSFYNFYRPADDKPSPGSETSTIQLGGSNLSEGDGGEDELGPQSRLT